MITTTKPARRIAGAVTVLVAAVALTACSQQLGDRGGQEGAPPDHIGDVDWIEVYRNADNFPNVARLCLLDRGFAATSSGLRAESATSPALIRMSEWDGFCASKGGDSRG